MIFITHTPINRSSTPLELQIIMPKSRKRSRHRHRSDSSRRSRSSRSSESYDSSSSNDSKTRRRQSNASKSKFTSPQDFIMTNEAAYRQQRRDVAKMAKEFGYTADNNPFNDQNLYEPFVWKKRQDSVAQGNSKGDPQDRLELIREIGKVRERRHQREREKEELALCV